MHPSHLLDAATELIGQVLRFDHPADAVAARFFRERRNLGPRERTLLGDTVFRLLRRKLYVEHLARSGSGALARRLAILAFAGPREVLAAALNADEQAWLAACDAMPEAELPAPCLHNLPGWLADELQAQCGDAFWPLAESLQQGAPLDVRVNTLVAKRAAVQAELTAAGVAAVATAHSPWGLRIEGKPSLAKLPAFVRGAVEVQDEGSQLLALLLDARRGEMVADFCAGAGGKTLAIGAAMRNTGRLYAFDTAAHRLDALKPRLARSGLTNVHTAAIAHERDERVARLTGKLDRVLVDAPCSGLGTLRRHPDLKWRQSPAGIAEFAQRQAAILQGAARLVKPGGRLVYATCSLLVQENEAITEAFGAAHPDFVPQEVADLLAALKVPAAQQLASGGPEGGRHLRLWPHRHGTDGFFAAVWTRRS